MLLSPNSLAIAATPGSAESMTWQSHDLKRSSQACMLVYKSFFEAGQYCPEGTSIVPVNDFWTGRLQGYSCVCDFAISAEDL